MVSRSLIFTLLLGLIFSNNAFAFSPDDEASHSEGKLKQ